MDELRCCDYRREGGERTFVPAYVVQMLEYRKGDLGPSSPQD